MLHSIVIPHRSRNRVLNQCLLSIDGSRAHSGCDDYEVIVVDDSDQVPILPDVPNVSILSLMPPPDGVFNKPQLLNHGIGASNGDLLTFLDADMLVGRDWLSAAPSRLGRRCEVDLNGEPPLTCLFYRVRHLMVTEVRERNQDIVLHALEACSTTRENFFARYDEFTRAFEARGCPWCSKPRHQEPLFGNSQLSIRRDMLADLRFNEDFSGYGFEDLWFIRELWWRRGQRYRAEICTAPNESLLHILHESKMSPKGPWYNSALNTRNQHLWQRDKRFRYSKGQIFRAECAKEQRR